MQDQSVPSSSNSQNKNSPALIYYHTEIDPIIDRLFPDPAVNQSVRVVLDAIAWKQRLKILQSKRDKEKRIDQAPEDLYCWFNHEFYLRLLGPNDYFRMMGLLVDNRILNKSDFTSVRGRHPIFQLANLKWLEGFTLKPITIQRVQKKLKNYHRWRKGHCAPIDDRMRQHIIDHFCQIGLSKQTFFALWERRYHTRYLQTKPNPLPLSEYMECGENCWQVIDRWNKSSDMDKLNPDWIHSDHFGNRFHHPFTYLPSDIRAYILDKNGNPIRFTEYDLANSQPALFANLLVDKDKRFRNSYLIQMIEACSIYEDLGRQLQLNRQLAKTEFLHFLFCRATSKAQKEFERLYDRPAIYAGMLKSKEYDDEGNYLPFDKRHILLPRDMQRMESKIFREIWTELLAIGFVFLPIHDAVYVANLNRSAKKEVLKIIKMKLHLHMNIRFKVKVKLISRDVLF